MLETKSRTMSLAKAEDDQANEPMEGECEHMEDQTLEPMNTSVDMTVIHEDSMDESHGTEDLQVTLQEAMALRKNLESKFEEEIKTSTAPSFRDKVAHFERMVSENRGGGGADLKKPPPTIVTAKDASASMDRLKVFLRVRPCLDKDSSTIEILDNSDGKSMPISIRTYPPETSNAAKTDRSRLKGNDAHGDTHAIKEYEFTSVLGPGTSQADVFKKTAASLVNGLCSGNTVGKSALLFCYGITNAGKTHTVLGDPRQEESWGIIPRCLSKAMRKVENTDMDLYLSCFEIYNEQLLDLLPSSSGAQGRRMVSTGVSLKIREGPHGHMVIPNLAEYKVDSMEAGLSLIRRAKEGRHTAPNHLNKQSSRSHSICQITIRRRKGVEENAYDVEANEPKALDESHLWIVDLAGNERSKRTNAGSLRQKEATYINMSLMNLMRCLTSTQKPYRDSKLTLLFMHHWGNPENQTTMIVNVHGAASDYDETQHVLSYAISSKSIPIVANKAQVMQKQKRSEYDLDGRRKGGKQLTMAQKAAKIIRKLSPKRVMPARKRKNQEAPGQETESLHAGREVEHPVFKKTRCDSPISNQTAKPNQPEDIVHDQRQAVSSRELSSLRMQLSVARAEIQGLETENRKMKQQIEHVETTVRLEVSEEMLQQTMDMRHRYEKTIQNLKESFAPNENGQEAEDLEKAESKIDELVDKVEECEEEMSRMARMHRAEIEAMKDDHQAIMTKKDNLITDMKDQLAENKKQSCQLVCETDEVTKLKKQLAAKDSEIERIKREKDELHQNYKLYYDEAGDEYDDDDAGSEKAGEANDGDDGDDDSWKTAFLQKQLNASRAQIEKLKRINAELSESHKQQLTKEVQTKYLETEILNLKAQLLESHQQIERMKRSKEEVNEKNDDRRVLDVDDVGDFGSSEEDQIDDGQQQSPSRTLANDNAVNIVSRLKSDQAVQTNESASTQSVSLVRKPFGKLTDNHMKEDAGSDGNLSPSKFLKPKKSPVQDTKTGLFARPKGRAPSKADGWDAKRGVWRLSTLS